MTIPHLMVGFFMLSNTQVGVQIGVHRLKTL